AQVELGDARSARKAVQSALQAGLKTLDKGITLVAVVEYAEFCTKRGDYVRAVELGSLVQAHFASWHETRKQAAALLDSLAGQLPSRKFAQASKRGARLDLWACARTSIAELGTRTSNSSANDKRRKK